MKGEFPGSPVVRTLCSRCRGLGFDLNRELRYHKLLSEADRHTHNGGMGPVVLEPGLNSYF